MNSSRLRPGLARVLTATLVGIDAARVRVETDVAADLPAFSLVGLPGAALRESRERVGAALRNAGFAWPEGRITVNLAPADLRKQGAAMDLAIAMSLLLASGQLGRPAASRLRRALFLGELALDGALRPTRGALALALDAPRLGVDEVFLPEAQARALAGELDRVRCVGVGHLRELPSALASTSPLSAPSPRARPATDDDPLAAVRGQRRAVRAVCLAAAGGHHLLLQGPPGCGKTLVARTLAALLPPLDADSRRERLRILGAVQADVRPEELDRPPLRAPHHTVSVAGLVGGGRPVVPGEITLAHRGVLFLDEIAEFGGDRLERLREPLEEGVIDLSRAGERVRLPASFQLVAAANPCPCGWHGSRLDRCRCPESALARHRRRLSGPLRDRIELWVEMDREPAGLLFRREPGSDRRTARRVRELRRAAAGTPNAALTGAALLERCRLDAEAEAFATVLADRAGVSLRRLHSTLRVARTIADLEGEDEVGPRHLAEAFSYRAPEG